MNTIKLPENITNNDFLDSVVSSLSVPREILAANEDIEDVWQRLPMLLAKIPHEFINPLIARMCVAVRVGLFDSAINYIWNATIINLRKKIIEFGVNEASELLNLQKELTITNLLEITDAQLLKYCLSLNLITETGYFFLDQCRNIRNNYSSAHPVNAGEMLDNYGLQSYINNCVKYSFTTAADLKGVDLKSLTTSLKSVPFKEEQLTFWYEAIKNTNETQKSVIFVRLHSLYCDSTSSESTRLNCLALFKICKEFVTDTTMSSILIQHQEYVSQGKNEKLTASRMFYQQTESLTYLNESEKNIIFINAIRNLENVHNQYNNFYNEPPFANYLFLLTKQSGVPDTVKREFVAVVVECSTGNGYGVSNVADIYYIDMVKNFSPAEIKLMIEMYENNAHFKFKLQTYSNCMVKYKELLKMISPLSVPKSLLSKYEDFIK